MADAATRHAQQKLQFDDIKLPKFYGSKSQDTISARDFARLIDTHVTDYETPQDAAYERVRKSFYGEAKIWLENKEDTVSAWVKTWAAFKPFFLEKFVQDDEALWIAFSKGTMNLRYGENFQNHQKKINDLFRTCFELMGTEKCPIAFDAIPENAANRATLKKFGTTCFNYVKMQLYRSTLPDDVVQHLKDKKPETLEDMVKIAETFFERSSKDKKAVAPAFVLAVDEPDCQVPTDVAQIDDYDEITAVFYNKAGKRVQAPRWATQRTPAFYPNSGSFPSSRPAYNNNQNRNNSQQTYGRNNSNANSAPKASWSSQPKAKAPLYCIFCQFSGHHQDDCRKRLQANAPCRRQDGSEYRPKGEQAKRRAVMEVAQPNEVQLTQNSVFQ